MLDNLKDLGIMAILVAVIGGLVAYALGFVLNPINGIDPIFGPLIGGIILVILMLYIAMKTNVDKMTFFGVVILLLMVSIVGTFVVGIFPLSAPYILTLTGTLNWTAISWSLVYVGIAMAVYDKVK